MKHFRLHITLIALVALALLSPCGVAVQLSDTHGSKKAESKESKTLDAGMTAGLCAEPTPQSYFCRATVSFTVNPFVSLHIVATTAPCPATMFQYTADSSASYDSPDNNRVNPRAPPSRSTV